MLLSTQTLALLTLAVVTVKGCGTAKEPSSPANSEQNVSAQQEPLTRLISTQSSGFGEAAELVIRDGDALANAWTTLSQGMAGFDTPTIDFSRTTVLLVAVGPRPTGGHSVRFESVTRAPSGTVARYVVTSPGPSCMTTQMVTSPVEAVSVARVDGDIRFEGRRVVNDC